MASGHGLVALILMLLDESTPNAVAVDIRIPPSAVKLQARFVAQWPRLAGRVTYVESSLRDVELTAEDHVVSAHACGALTDDVLSCALLAQASVAVLPCCQAEGKNDTAGLLGWMDSSLAIDVARAQRMRQAGYQIYTQTIPETITPKNRLLIAMAQRRPSPEPAT